MSPPRKPPSPTRESPAAGGEPAERAAALLSALIRHRPLARGNDQAAVLATVTFLAVNGWQVDLEPAEDTAAVVADLAAGRRSAADLAAWLSPRISAYREPAVSPSTSQGGTDAWMAAESEADLPA